MADQKFTLEEILKEYSADGKRSGIQKADNKPIAPGKLETEKLLNAATSHRPMPYSSTYRAVASTSPPAEEPQESLVDIKSTISQIKAAQEAQRIQEAKTAPVLRERFPTQKLRREQVSFLGAGGARTAGNGYPSDGISEYDGAVKVASSEQGESLSEQRHRPNIRQMEDSTRSREKKRKNRRRKKAEISYTRETITGVFSVPESSAEQESQPTTRRRWEEEQGYYYQAPHDSTQTIPAQRRMRVRSTAETVQEKKPDHMAEIREQLCNLRNAIFFRCVTLLLLTICGAILGLSESLPHSPAAFLISHLTLRGYAIVQLALGAIGLAVAFPTVKNGIRNFIRFHADSDSMAVLPLLPAMAGAICAVISPSVLEQETVHLFLPCALLALLCNAIGRLLVVRRALRGCLILAHDTKKRVLSYVSQEETAELLTRGVLSDFPIVTAVRRTKSLCDYLRYTYSNDMADALCRPMTPICAGLALVVSVGMTLIRMGLHVDMLWVSFLLTLMTLLLTAGSCIGSALVVNLPLERESKKAAAGDSVMLGYQSVDDFFDTNALLVEAGDMFPNGSVKIQGMKVFSGGKMDDVMLDAASLVHHAGSIMDAAFLDMIPERENLRRVDEFVCEDGLGLCGWIGNRRVLFGSREMMTGHNIEGLPTKTREAELAEGDGDVLYLSVSGVLTAMFSIQITADPKVRRQMQALQQERIALVIQSVDSSVTLRRISALFGFPEHLIKIIPVSMHNLFQRETADLDCASASMVVGKTSFGAAQLIVGARKVRRSAMRGVILQIVSSLLGLSLALIHIFTGAYSEMNAQFFLLYHLILTIVTALAIRVR